MEKRFIWASLAIVLAVAGISRAGMALNNELTISAGVGQVYSQAESRLERVGSLTYLRALTNKIAFEGGYDFFKVWGDRSDGAWIGGVYHFVPFEQTRRFIPFGSAGIGFTAVDPTEWATHFVIRAGAGVKYYVSERLGFRAELRAQFVRPGQNVILADAEGSKVLSMNFGFSFRY